MALREILMVKKKHKTIYNMLKVTENLPSFGYIVKIIKQKNILNSNLKNFVQLNSKPYSY